MYLNIGGDMAVRDRSIVGIFDLDNTSTSKRTREFLETAEKEGQVAMHWRRSVYLKARRITLKGYYLQNCMTKS